VAHIDILVNDYPAAIQRRVASLYIQGDRIEIESEEPEVWRDRLLRPIPTEEPGVATDPDDNPEAFLKALIARLQGSYLVATDWHPRRACPIPESGVVPMDELSSRSI